MEGVGGTPPVRALCSYSAVSYTPPVLTLPQENSRDDSSLQRWRAIELPLLCHCGRPYGVAQVDPMQNRVVVSTKPIEQLRAHVRDSSFDLLEPRWTETPGSGWRRQFTCHPRCKAKRVLTERHLTEAFVRAARAGRGELRFGDNL